MHSCSEGVCDAADCCMNYCNDHQTTTGSSITCEAGLGMVSNTYQAGCPSTDTNGDGTLGDECNAATCCGRQCTSWTGTCIGAQAGWNNGMAGECGTPERERQRATLCLALPFRRLGRIFLR